MTACGSATFGLSLLILACELVAAESVPVFATTYDVSFSFDDHEYRASSRALVRAGNEIPNLLQDFKIGLRVNDKSPDHISVQVIIYEKDGADWRQIIVPPPEFTGELGTPIEYVWESGGMTLDIAIVVGVYEPRM